MIPKPEPEPEAGLQQQVARLAKQQQELIATRDRLDREVSRFEQMHEFYAAAMATDDQTDLARLSVEAVCQIFEVEVAALIAVDWPQRAVGQVVVCHGADPKMFDLRSTHALRAGVGADRRRASLWASAEARNLVGPGFSQLAATVCSGSDGTEIALLVVGVRETGSRFFPRIEREQVGPLSLMAHQIGSLIQARWHSARIAQQVQQLEVEKKRLKLALDGSAAGLWDWHVDTARVYYSQRWKQMLGYESDQIGDELREWETRIHPEDRKASIARVESTLREPGHHYENTHRLRHADGHYVWVMSRGTVLRDAEGRATRMVGIHVDVTAAYEARERAEAASRAKSEFLATMSHEIRTPLNGVTGMLELLRECDPTDEQNRYIDVAHDSADQLMSVINGVLDLSRLESGQVEFETLPFSPAAELTDAAGLLRAQYQAKGVRLDVLVEDGLAHEALGDATRLRQVVTNLVGNALKFTSSGGVQLRVGGNALPEGYELCFVVEDTGIGIAPEALPTLFDSFVQADASTSRRFGGSGLGLAICHRLVVGMGGRIDVQSRLGQGSRFTVRIPLGLPAGASMVSGPDGLTPYEADTTAVLLVEDNAVNQMVAKAMLERIGCVVEVVADGPSALEALTRRRFDLVFMDVHMPGMDGLETVRQWRAMEGSTRTPVIALTANVLEQTRQECMSAGMDDFVAKPVAKAVLAAVVARWLPQAKGLATAPGR